MILHRRPTPLRLERLEDKTVPSTAFALTDANAILRFDTSAPGTILNTLPVTGLAAGENLVGIDFRPRTGELIGFAALDNGASDATRLYKIEPLTGAATAIGTGAPLVSGNGVYGVDFNPTVDRLRITNAANDNARFNPNNGARADAPVNDTDLNATGPIVGVAYDRNFDRQTVATPANGVIPTSLFGIDGASSRLVKIGGIDGVPSPNGGATTNVGALGVTLDAGRDGGFDIAPGAGNGRAFAALTSGGTTRLYTLDLATGAATGVGAIGTGAAGIRGLAIQADDIAVTGTGPGVQSIVRVFDTRTNDLKFSVLPYVSQFTGGVNVASGDVTGDGVPDVVTAAGPGGGPHVKVFDGVTGQEVRSFYAFDETFSGGVNVATGDLNADGFDDIIAGASRGSSAVRAFNGRTGAVLVNVDAYPGFNGGSRVAAGDFDLDGDAEIVTAAGPGGGPHVRVFDAAGAPFASAALPNFSNSFFAYDTGFRGGVFVATGDVNGDGRPDIITGADAGGGPHVQVYSGSNTTVLRSFFAFDSGFAGGVRVSSADFDGDGRADIVASAGPKSEPLLRIFSALDLSPLRSIFAEDRVFDGGLYVG